MLVSKVKQLMDEKRITVRALMQMTGLSNLTVVRARDSRIVKCRLETLEVIARALGVRVTDLFSEKD